MCIYIYINVHAYALVLLAPNSALCEAKALLHKLALRFSGHLVFVMLNSTRDALLMRPMGLDPRLQTIYQPM